jgi:hypothetical protein
MTLARNRLLVKSAHIVMCSSKARPSLTGNSKSRRTPTNGELLGTDFAANPCQHREMKQNGKTSMTPARTTLASVKKEMQKPRLAESVRNDGKDPVPSTGPQPPPKRRGFSRAEPH